MKTYILISLTALLFFCSCRKNEKNTQFIAQQTKIVGSLKNYKQIYKTGKLTFFDAVTRTVNDHIFSIDENGDFTISFDLLHPIIGSIYLDIENEYHSAFYIKPNTTYKLTITDKGLSFEGKTGVINNQILNVKKALNASLTGLIKEADALFKKNLSIEAYINFQKNVEKEKIAFLKTYIKTNSFHKKTLNILINEAKFKTAHRWINYRYDLTKGKPIPRKLPAEFYEKLWRDYPINTSESYESRNSIDYISNMVSVLLKKGGTLDKRIKFYTTFNYFSPKEIAIITKIYQKNNDIFKSKEFIEFNTQENKDLEYKLSQRYAIHTLLTNVQSIKQNIGRDLIISQAISKKYISNGLSPTAKEWSLIKKLMQNKAILNYLKIYSQQKPEITPFDNETNEIIHTSLKKVKQKYIDKYVGKVIYINFFATWCSPCREEIPFEKMIQQEFKNNDIIFLNLCAKSEKENWKNLIEQKSIEGENYLLNNEEFILLSKEFKVHGFPTYILIDKKGKVIDFNAPRPSSKESIIKLLNTQLSKK